MKIFISADMEGATGVVDWDDVTTGKRQYERFRSFLTRDVAAAVKGAFEGGADEILINEAHGRATNILIEDLPSEVSMISGHVGRKQKMMEGIDESFDAAFLVAYHAMEGTSGAVLSHTFSPNVIRKIRLRDKVMGELGISAITAGHFEVPVTLVTGDDKLAKEATDLLGSVESAIVKYGISRYSARCLTPTKTSMIIQEAAKNATKRIAETKPFKLEYPLEVKIEFMTELQASESCSKLGFTKVSTTTASFICSNALEINRVINEASRIKDRVFGPIP